MRAELSTLLRQHRIQQRIGGAGSHTVPVSTTPAQRHEIGQLIQRYRTAVLTWCGQALDCAAGPHTGAPGATDPPHRVLRQALQRTTDAATAGRPTMGELTTPHPFALVETWRRAARAAVLGEPDVAGDLADGRLDHAQRLTVLKDAAEILRALLVLDRRYSDIPGWQPLTGARRLQRAAEACALVQAGDDYTIDRRGWRPPARAVDGPARPGIAGVLQAQHNLLIHLHALPTALNYRRLLDSQQQLSHLLADRAALTDPAQSTPWTARAAGYATLHRHTRNLGGHIGAGGPAVAEAANAVSRLRDLPPDKPLSRQALRSLAALCQAVDTQMADHFARAARDRLYLTAVTLPTLAADDGALTHRPRQRFTAITTPTAPDLIQLVDQLRPPTTTPTPPPHAHASRLELTEAITHRPQPPSDSLGL